MLIANPPVEITGHLAMLGTNEYPLFLVKSGDESLLFEGGTGSMGPLVLQQMEKLGLDLIVYTNQEGVDAGVGPFSHGSEKHTDIMKTQALKQALNKYKFDAIEHWHWSS